jgi:REP element-mobilizing transposase RayT
MLTASSRKVFRRRGKPQLEIAFKQLDRNGQHRGGRREGAGRKPKGARPGSPHKRRAAVDRRHPQHVTLRVVGDIPNLRTPDTYRAIRQAFHVTGERHDFRIVHFSIQGNHIHLLVEAESKQALALGVKGFQVSAAKRINALVRDANGKRRRGQVFADRYHVHPLKTVEEVRNAICYVLNNFRKHGVRRGPFLFDGKLDPYSSAVFFPGWRERTTPAIHIPPEYEVPRVCSPETWLLKESWKRARPISCFEVPGPHDRRLRPSTHARPWRAHARGDRRRAG